ncbi:hypothetical protein [Herbidospora sp. RD11066]
MTTSANLHDRDALLKFARLTSDSWSDSSVGARFAQDPRATLAEYGVIVPAGMPIPPLLARPTDACAVEALENAASPDPFCIATIYSIGSSGTYA